MRRFLGATINTSSSNNNTSRSTTPSSSVDSSPSPSPRTPIPNDYTNNNNTTALVSSTKRAFQQTFGQLSYSKSNASSRNNAQPLHHQKQVPSVSLSLPDDHHHQEAAEDIEASSSSSPVPPTPPSKHGHTLNDEEDDNDNEPAWVDDARSLPFGSSSLLSRAPSSSSRGMIGRSSNSSSSNGHHSEYNEQDTTIVAMHQDPSSSSHQRNSTATISASRYKEDHHHHNQPLSPSMQDYNGSEGLGSLAASNSLAPATMHLSSSQQSPQLYNHTGLTVSATYAANASSLVDLKDEMMLELLSSDALIHVAQFEILGFDEVEELRKEHSILSNRLQSLQNKLSIETKIRDAALSISRLYSTKRLSLRQKQHAEEELRNSDKKVEFLSNEVNRLFKKENEIKNRILRHMAAVLALSFRKLEAGQQQHLSHSYMHSGQRGGDLSSSSFRNLPPTSANSSHNMSFFPNKSDYSTAPSSAASSRTGPYTPLSATFPPPPSSSSHHSSSNQEKQALLSPTGLYSPTFSTTSTTSRNNNKAAVQPFEGPHFFANNKDAIVPGAHSAITPLSVPISTQTRPSSPNPSTTSARSPSFSNLALFTSSSSASSRSNTPALNQISPPHHNDNNKPLLSPALSTNSTTLGYMDFSSVENQIQDLNSQLSKSQNHSIELQNTIDLLQREKSELASRLNEINLKNVKESNDTLKQLNESQNEIQRLKEDLKRAHLTLEENMKDAALWEEESMKLQQGFENERQDMMNRLRNTLSRYSGNERMTHIGQYLPQVDQVQTIDMSRFLTRDLDEILSGMNDSHTKLSNEITQLQNQIEMQRDLSKQATDKTEDENRTSKNKIDQLQQEKQILMKKITRIESENIEIKSLLKEINEEHDNLKSKHLALNERFEASSTLQADSERRMAIKIKEVDKVHSERLLEAQKVLSNRDLENKDLKNKLDKLQFELTQIKNEKVALLKNLEESVWKNLPNEDTLKARLALKDSDDIMKYKAVWLSTATSPKQQQDDNNSNNPFTIEKLSERIQSILKTDENLISRLISHEDHASSHKAASIRAEKLLQESKKSLQSYNNQVKNLEEHIELMNKKEVEMLERLNDLSLTLEQSRSNVKKSENSIQVLEKKCISLEKEKDNLQKKIINIEKEKEKLANKNEYKIKIANLEKESTELRDELTSAQDELDELRSRESRQRVQLLDELTQLTEEASSLRAQLRTAQRKLASAGK